MRIPFLSKGAARNPGEGSGRGGSRAGYVIEVRIESGARLYYRFGAGPVERVTEPPAGVPLVSAVYAPPGRADDDTADDYRIALPKKMSAGQAAGFVQREMSLFSKVRAIVDGHVAYATPATKMTAASSAVIPLSIPVERLMKKSGTTPPAVSGVMFGDSDLLVLMAYPGNGRVQVQTSISPDNVHEIISSFATSAGIPDGESVEIYTEEELLSAIGESQSYPADGEIAGMPVSTVATWALIGGIVGVVGGAAVYGYSVHKMRTDEAVVQQYKQAEAASLAQIVGRLVSNPSGLGERLSADFTSGIGHAKYIWIDGGRIESDIKHGADSHTLYLPVFKSSGESPLPEDRILEAVTRPSLPQGCTNSGTTISGGMNEIQAKYDCVNTGEGGLNDFGG